MKRTTFVPKDPILLGKTPNGEPIWMEPKDLIPTPDEERERVHNTKVSRENEFIREMASLVLENAVTFVEETCLKTAGREGLNVYGKGDAQKSFQWALKAGYEAIQDGLKTVVKYKGRVIREMTAKIEQRYAGLVAKKVMEMVGKLPSKV